MSNLKTTESLDRSSPELWSNQGPPLPLHNSTVSAWEAEIEQDDVDMLQELASLTSAQLKDKIDTLLKMSYQLGVQETYEMTRGKFLNVLPKEL